MWPSAGVKEPINGRKIEDRRSAKRGNGGYEHNTELTTRLSATNQTAVLSFSFSSGFIS